MLRNKITELPVGTIFNNKEILAIKRVLKSGTPLIRGKNFFEFEKKFAKYIGAKCNYNKFLWWSFKHCDKNFKFKKVIILSVKQMHLGDH